MNVKILRLGDLLDNNRSFPAKQKRKEMIDGFKFRVVYVIYEEETPIYVGSTNYDARTRIGQHISQKSDLGMYIKNNLPRSNDWTIHMIATSNSCQLRQVEFDLIHTLNPKLNVRGIGNE